MYMDNLGKTMTPPTTTTPFRNFLAMPLARTGHRSLDRQTKTQACRPTAKQTDKMPCRIEQPFFIRGAARDFSKVFAIMYSVEIKELNILCVGGGGGKCCQPGLVIKFEMFE